MRKLTLIAAAALALATGGLGAASASAAPVSHQTHQTTTAAGKDRQFGRAICKYGQLCTEHNGVYNWYTACTVLYLSGWTQSGEYMNNQTTGTKTTFYRLDGSVYSTSTAYELNGIDWDPIWKIRVCP